ncbi:MAG TPA: hypothetical protein VEI97_17445 [bacterium]|nr:hypothetical protein [bacterium]
MSSQIRRNTQPDWSRYRVESDEEMRNFFRGIKRKEGNKEALDFLGIVLACLGLLYWMS